MTYWVARTRCGYKVLTSTGQHLMFFTHPSHVKSYVFGKEYKYVGLTSSTDRIHEYEQATGERFIDYSKGSNF